MFISFSLVVAITNYYFGTNLFLYPRVDSIDGIDAKYIDNSHASLKIMFSVGLSFIPLHMFVCVFFALQTLPLGSYHIFHNIFSSVTHTGHTF